MTYINGSNKILLQGISTAPDNFSATNKTYLITPQASLGIDEIGNDLKAKITYYPNPASEVINLKIQNLNISNAQLNIYNMAGQRVHAQRISKHEEHIIVAHFTKGIYFVELTTNEWSDYQKIIIKK